jgi:hypothetical protein
MSHTTNESKEQKMKLSNKVRAVAAGALTLALFAGGATVSAFAAPGDVLNPQSNGSKGSFYLWNADDFTLSDGNPARVYTRSENLVGAASSSDFNAEINPSATRPVTGAASFGGVYRFISDKTPAALAGGTNTWKAYATDSATGANGGTQLPNMTLDEFGPSVPAVIGTGGSFWYGVAYTTNNGVTTVGAVYREINITAGSGDYTVGAVETETVVQQPTDVTTTTTLAAGSTSVDVGQTTVLTATVAAPGKTVTGNVEFFKGLTSLGTVGLSAGSASKTVTVAAAGANVYSAKFVANTVGLDNFLTSTSSDVTVTATVPTVAMPPDGPSESALNASTVHGASAGYDNINKTASLTGIPAASEGVSVNVFAYSTLTYLGTKTITGGIVTVDVSTMALGVHKLAVTDPTTGDVIAWGSFDKTDAATKPTISKTINADVAALAPADGAFSLTNLSGAVVNLTNPALVNGASVVSGELGDFKVTDLRQVSKPGWDLKTEVAQFVKGADTIENTALGLAPKVISPAAGTGASAPTLGAAQVSGSALYPFTFATLEAAKFSGVSTYNADLVFTAPSGKPAGTYTSTLTLTLISK